MPAGRTCGDCAHWRRCKGLIQILTGKETSCDFSPSRYREPPAPARQLRPHLLYVRTVQRGERMVEGSISLGALDTEDELIALISVDAATNPARLHTSANRGGG